MPQYPALRFFETVYEALDYRIISVIFELGGWRP